MRFMGRNGKMTTIEARTHSLAENEDVIRRGLSTFVEVGQALMAIRDERQYITAGFDRFEDYCRERWDMGRSYADDKIAASRVCVITQNPPTSEWVAKPLATVLNQDGEDAVRQAWSQIVEAHAGDGPVTGKDVRRFLTVGGANYGKPGWFEMLGEVAMTLERADKQLARLEGAISRRPNAAFRERADDYAEMADDLSQRLRTIANP